MNDGKLVPDEIMIGLVTEEATPQVELGKSMLLDGFPRNVDRLVHVPQKANLNRFGGRGGAYP